MVHAKCVGLTACIRNIIQGKDDPVFCAHHWTDVTRWNDRTTIELKHLMQGRAEYIRAQQQKKESGEAEAVGVFLPMKPVALITGMPLAKLNASIPVNKGGFAQRHVATHSKSTVEEAIRKDGYSHIFGTIAVVEIPRSQAEVADLQAKGLLPAEYTYPKKTLLQMLQAQPKDAQAGEVMLVTATDLSYQMELRRFAIIDGNNRVMALVMLTSEFKGTDRVFPQTFTCWLVNVESTTPWLFNWPQ